MTAKSEKQKDGQRLVCKNKRALHNYAITRRLEAGVALRGTEVKSCRDAGAEISEAYVQVLHGEAFLIGCRIAEFKQGNRFNHVPDRTRKLLLHRKEIDKLEVELCQQGRVAVPLSLYFKDGRLKLELGVGIGKKHADRRNEIKEREVKRELARVLRRGSRG